VQVVLGPIADQVAGEIRRVLHAGAPAPTPTQRSPAPHMPSTTELLAALGGAPHGGSVDCAGGRLLVRVVRRDPVDLAVLASLCPRGAMISSGGMVHVLLGAAAERAWQSLRARLATPGGR
jgi:PTS system N-acetylglucosamine-specific IIC component